MDWCGSNLTRAPVNKYQYITIIQFCQLLKLSWYQSAFESYSASESAKLTTSQKLSTTQEPPQALQISDLHRRFANPCFRFALQKSAKATTTNLLTKQIFVLVRKFGLTFAEQKSAELFRPYKRLVQSSILVSFADSEATLAQSWCQSAPEAAFYKYKSKICKKLSLAAELPTPTTQEPPQALQISDLRRRFANPCTKGAKGKDLHVPSKSLHKIELSYRSKKESNFRQAD